MNASTNDGDGPKRDRSGVQMPKLEVALKEMLYKERGPDPHHIMRIILDLLHKEGISAHPAREGGGIVLPLRDHQYRISAERDE